MFCPGLISLIEGVKARNGPLTPFSFMTFTLFMVKSLFGFRSVRACRPSELFWTRVIGAARTSDNRSIFYASRFQ